MAPPRRCFVRNLGIDYAPGRSRSALPRGSVLSFRFRIAAKKIKRLIIFRSAAGGGRASTLLRTKILPTLAYGAPVNGISDNERKRMETIVAASLAPYSRGSRRTAKLIAHGAPSDVHLVASFIRLAQ